MKTVSSTGFALFGASLVAISYGLARFAFGLFVPPIRGELELTTSVIGVIGALPLISFVLATLVAPMTTDRLGARNTAMLAGGFGAVGLGVISRWPGVRSCLYELDGPLPDDRRAPAPRAVLPGAGTAVHGGIAGAGRRFSGGRDAGQ